MDPNNSINNAICCPKCRSIDIIKSSETSFLCRTCSNEISLYNGEDISEIYNKLYELSKKPDKDFITGGIVKEKFTMEEFKKATYEFLRVSERVPSYVFEEFQCDNIMIYEVPIMMIEGKVDVNYSRTLGYDREEVYSRTYSYTDFSGKKAIDTRLETETVTDWRQDSGLLRGKSKHAEINMDITDYDGLLNEIDFIDYLNLVPLTNYELSFYHVNKNKLEILKKKMVDKLYQDKLPQAGDYSKNEQYDGMVDIENSSLLIVRIYYMAIHLRNIKAIFYSMASGRLNVYMTGEFPKENDENEFQEKLEKMKREASKLSLIFKILAIIPLIFGILNFYLNIIKTNENKIMSSFFILYLCIFPCAIFVIISEVSKKVNKKKIEKIIEERKKNILNIKSESLYKINLK